MYRSPIHILMCRSLLRRDTSIVRATSQEQAAKETYTAWEHAEKETNSFSTHLTICSVHRLVARMRARRNTDSAFADVVLRADKSPARETTGVSSSWLHHFRWLAPLELSVMWRSEKGLVASCISRCVFSHITSVVVYCRTFTGLVASCISRCVFSCITSVSVYSRTFTGLVASCISRCVFSHITSVVVDCRTFTGLVASCISRCVFSHITSVFVYSRTFTGLMASGIRRCVCSHIQTFTSTKSLPKLWDFLVHISWDVYGVATISRLLKITGLFCRISSLL